MTIKEKIIKIIDIILDEELMYKDNEVLSLPVTRFKEEGIYAEEFSKIMEKLTSEGCLVSEEDFDICNFDHTYIFHMNYAMVKPDYKKLKAYKKQIMQNKKRVKLKDYTTGNNKLYINGSFVGNLKRLKKDVILIYFAERYNRSICSVRVEEFMDWCSGRYPEICNKIKDNIQGGAKWFRNGIDDINDKNREALSGDKLIIFNKKNDSFDITKSIEIK
ncbi:hypothetical protein A2303_02015 [Candidatus Falkowbacteria bacterium RIFOXYB2_FULL_47_14]|uniref:Uncharacterized protein n=1 Tax=Candidatus Falkowbacteria bacterium RIFOXYA2_FULL_47_19 TaxID=1797994 RepID=A0A1F5SN66_9BACT|nr:MAG: hypothetical protein A2227_06675 [Candidatus Falkowbacteria bacterium RIFOXYA2_FULL_47_19]OGF34608.1 MAG: hypothetical protein A2468_07920 [Candidatus Falkowbacteria bacterium RIFOXYC2_FULL_46_15]OGF43227.1 MAG: hypothetical protein A2303_02015 [Candidatus Falkowbacteria bacterium RIFOXYB2_FULL_47_14]